MIRRTTLSSGVIMMGDLDVLMYQDRQRAVRAAIDLVVNHGITPEIAGYLAFAGMPTRIGEVARRAISVEPFLRTNWYGAHLIRDPEIGFVWKLKGKEDGQKT